MNKNYILLFLLLLWLPMSAIAQIEKHVFWSGERVGDSVKLMATIDEGWHMTLISVGEDDYGDEIYTSPYSLTLAEAMPIRYNTCNDQMCTAPEIYNWEEASEPLAEKKDNQGDRASNWMLFIWGLLAGLLAIFTPCVWPIIPMTVSFFLKKGGGVRDAILYGLSIIFIYVGLGLLITIVFGASALNNLATNAVFNIICFLLLVVFALSFFGLFELTLPAGWSTSLDNKARKTGGIISIVLMAFTLVIVSFSCTGPIIGTLLVEAAGQSLLAPTVGMFGFALALALPFTLFALFPQWMQSLPKSGEWMGTFKVCLAFIELALSLKFLSVADMAYGWGILPRWLFILIWVIIFVAMGIYLFVNTRKAQKKSGKLTRIALGIVSIVFAAYLVPGVWGAPVKAISAFAPPLPIEGQEEFDDFEVGMAYAKQEHKPVLLQFTGYGCVNCRKMESYVLANDSVQQRLKNYVLITLYVDDRQDIDGDQEPEGVENSRLQQERFGSNAQPFFVQLNSQGEQEGTPIAYTTNPLEFINWLKY